MNGEQVQYNKMCKSTIKYIDLAPPATIAAAVHFPTWYTPFKVHVQDVNTYWNFQNRDTTGLARSKDNLKVLLSNESLDLSAKLASLATFLEDQYLLGLIDFNESDFSKVSDSELLTYTDIISQKVEEHMADLAPYGVVMATLTDYQALIEEFTSAIPLPRNEIAAKKTATEALSHNMSEARRFLKKMDRALKAIRKDHPEFYDGYVNVRRIVDPQERVIAIRGKVIDENGNPIRVFMSCPELGIYRKVSPNCTFYIKTDLTGNFTFIFTRPNYQTVTIVISTFQGERTEVTITMLPH